MTESRDDVKWLNKLAEDLKGIQMLGSSRLNTESLRYIAPRLERIAARLEKAMLLLDEMAPVVFDVDRFLTASRHANTKTSLADYTNLKDSFLKDSR